MEEKTIPILEQKKSSTKGVTGVFSAMSKALPKLTIASEASDFRNTEDSSMRSKSPKNGDKSPRNGERSPRNIDKSPRSPRDDKTGSDFRMDGLLSPRGDRAVHSLEKKTPFNEDSPVVSTVQGQNSTTGFCDFRLETRILPKLAEKRSPRDETSPRIGLGSQRALNADISPRAGAKSPKSAETSPRIVVESRAEKRLTRDRLVVPSTVINPPVEDTPDKCSDTVTKLPRQAPLLPTMNPIQLDGDARSRRRAGTYNAPVIDPNTPHSEMDYKRLFELAAFEYKKHGQKAGLPEKILKAFERIIKDKKNDPYYPAACLYAGEIYLQGVVDGLKDEQKAYKYLTIAAEQNADRSTKLSALLWVIALEIRGSETTPTLDPKVALQKLQELEKNRSELSPSEQAVLSYLIATVGMHFYKFNGLSMVCSHLQNLIEEKENPWIQAASLLHMGDLQCMSKDESVGRGYWQRASVQDTNHLVKAAAIARLKTGLPKFVSYAASIIVPWFEVDVNAANEVTSPRNGTLSPKVSSPKEITPKTSPKNMEISPKDFSPKNNDLQKESSLVESAGSPPHQVCSADFTRALGSGEIKGPIVPKIQRSVTIAQNQVTHASTSPAPQLPPLPQRPAPESQAKRALSPEGVKLPPPPEIQRAKAMTVGARDIKLPPPPSIQQDTPMSERTLSPRGVQLSPRVAPSPAAQPSMQGSVRALSPQGTKLPSAEAGPAPIESRSTTITAGITIPAPLSAPAPALSPTKSERSATQAAPKFAAIDEKSVLRSIEHAQNYLYGLNGVKQDYQGAINILERLDKMIPNHLRPRVDLLLGVIYYKGLGKIKEFGSAFYYLRRAEQQQFDLPTKVIASAWLGDFFSKDNTHDVDEYRNSELAKSHFAFADQHKDNLNPRDKALVSYLYAMYYLNFGLESDKEKAFGLLFIAANQSANIEIQEEACIPFGDYFAGDLAATGVIKEKEQAIKYWTIASKSSNEEVRLEAENRLQLAAMDVVPEKQRELSWTRINSKRPLQEEAKKVTTRSTTEAEENSSTNGSISVSEVIHLIEDYFEGTLVPNKFDYQALEAYVDSTLESRKKMRLKVYLGDKYLTGTHGFPQDVRKAFGYLSQAEQQTVDALAKLKATRLLARYHADESTTRPNYERYALRYYDSAEKMIELYSKKERVEFYVELARFHTYRSDPTAVNKSEAQRCCNIVTNQEYAAESPACTARAFLMLGIAAMSHDKASAYYFLKNAMGTAPANDEIKMDIGRQLRLVDRQ